eukprot:gnl/MRDRNA2_/MRDRNA2_27914_c0_seq1.p1 gnl/MRDRNA2_/MRDRNA2_27914_c0~~gnl/MRDRNA2_/MRDRNA2_27914_c0_seq1.p1  ORF type:complete len:630 (-),score=103.07 gnl/MRDRNA2_/MRDRNA2_27914_c0_seq1:11-1900(-)
MITTDWRVSRTSGVPVYSQLVEPWEQVCIIAFDTLLHGRAVTRKDSLWLVIDSPPDNVRRSIDKARERFGFFGFTGQLDPYRCWVEITDIMYPSLGVALEWTGEVWGKEVKKGLLEISWSHPFDLEQEATFTVLWELEAGFWSRAWEGPIGPSVDSDSCVSFGNLGGITSCSTYLPAGGPEEKLEHGLIRSLERMNRKEIAVCIAARVGGFLLRTPPVVIPISGFPDFDMDLPAQPSKDISAEDEVMLKLIAMAMLPTALQTDIVPPGHTPSAEEESQMLAAIEEQLRRGVPDVTKRKEARQAALQVSLRYVPRNRSVKSEKAIVALPAKFTSIPSPLAATRRKGGFSAWAAGYPVTSATQLEAAGTVQNPKSHSAGHTGNSVRRVLVMGLYHACTNAMVQELQRNFEVEVLNAGDYEGQGWKHRSHRRRPACLKDKDVFTILMTKEPHFWLSSTGRTPGKFHSVCPVQQQRDGRLKPVDFDERKMDHLFGTVEHDGILYPNAIAFWSDVVCSYFDDTVYPPERSVIVRCEDFLYRWQDVMDSLAAKGLQKKTEGINSMKPLEGRAKPHPSVRTREEALQFYRSEKNRVSGFSREQLKRIQDEAEVSAVAALAYGVDAVTSWGCVKDSY